MSPAEVTEMIMKYGKAYEKRMRIKPVAMAINICLNLADAGLAEAPEGWHKDEDGLWRGGPEDTEDNHLWENKYD